MIISFPFPNSKCSISGAAKLSNLSGGLVDTLINKFQGPGELSTNLEIAYSSFPSLKELLYQE